MNIYEAMKAREASIILQAVESDAKRKALESIKEALEAHQEAIFKANQVDIEMSEAQNVSMPVLKRLRFDKAKLQDVLDGIESLVHMEEPVGKVQMQTELDEGLILTRVSCPIGVIGVIFESRPDALVQISSLCLKSGNAVLLKGGVKLKRQIKFYLKLLRRLQKEQVCQKDGLHLWRQEKK